MTIDCIHCQEELHRLTDRPEWNGRLTKSDLVRVISRSHRPARTVQKRAIEVLVAVDQVAIESECWPSVEEWREKLPAWFVAKCAPEKTEVQEEEWLMRWKKLSPDEQAQAEENEAWSLADWIYWFEPKNRSWYWWNAVPKTPYTLLIRVEAKEWPLPIGSLKWLLRTAGADEVEQELSTDVDQPIFELQR